MKNYLPFYISLFALVLFASCEDEEPLVIDVPDSYADFENVNYDGQTQRLGQLAELTAYLKSASDGNSLNASLLAARYANQPNAAWDGTYSDSKQLRNKTFESEQPQYDLLLDAAADASTVAQAVPGTAGIVVSADGAKKYHVNANGVEYAQVIEKGLMGALLYYQSTGVYLEPGKMDVDNEEVIPGEGTAMQHHWDEAFGYWGVPQDFPSNTDGLLFWGDYTNDRDALLGSNEILMDAFKRGRAAIGQNQLDIRDAAIQTIRKEWERVVAATALHYLNSAAANFDDPALRLHALSEAVAFTYALQFNPQRSISLSETARLLTELGGSTQFNEMNLYNIDAAGILTVRDELATAAGLSALKEAF